MTVKEWNKKVRKANVILERLEEDPDNVSIDETFFAMSICFGEPVSKMKKKYKKMKRI